MKNTSYEKWGSLATHRAFLGKPPKAGDIAPFKCSARAVFAKQVSGLSKRLKAIGCRKVVVGLSGGLDSTLALLVINAAFEKLKYPKDGICVVMMPGFASTRRTKSNAVKFCDGLGIGYEVIPIGKATARHLISIGHDAKTPDITYENAQARMRTLILMNKANLIGGIVVGTGDMSEIALGWCTYNGDHMSMFAVNNGVPKTIVKKVCAWWARQNRSVRGLSVAAAAVEDVLATPISPELVKGQVTEDALGPYEVHDFYLWNFIMNEMSPADLLKNAVTYFKGRYSENILKSTLRTFMRRFFSQAFKRNCQPDGVRVFPFELLLRSWWVPSDIGANIFKVP